MAKNSKHPAANDWSGLPCENLLDGGDGGFYEDDPDSLSISESTWVAGAAYRARSVRT